MVDRKSELPYLRYEDRVITFRNKLQRTEDLMKRRLTVGGVVEPQRVFQLSAVQRCLESIEDGIKPCRPGYGVIGEATLRAAHGGPL